MHLRVLDVARDHTGTAVVEFTIVLPVLLLLTLGLAQFGIIFYNFTLVGNAAAAGARQLSISEDPNAYCDTVNAINIGSGGLGGSGTCTSNLTIALVVNGKSCSQTACTYPTVAAYPPQSASVTVSYACSANWLLPAYLLNLASLCPTTRTMQGALQ